MPQKVCCETVPSCSNFSVKCAILKGCIWHKICDISKATTLIEMILVPTESWVSQPIAILWVFPEFSLLVNEQFAWSHACHDPLKLSQWTHLEPLQLRLLLTWLVLFDFSVSVPPIVSGHGWTFCLLTNIRICLDVCVPVCACVCICVHTCMCAEWLDFILTFPSIGKIVVAQIDCFLSWQDAIISIMFGWVTSLKLFCQRPQKLIVLNPLDGTRRLWLYGCNSTQSCVLQLLFHWPSTPASCNSCACRGSQLCCSHNSCNFWPQVENHLDFEMNQPLNWILPNDVGLRWPIAMMFTTCKLHTGDGRVLQKLDSILFSFLGDKKSRTSLKHS